jgi:hypothetical protein
VIAAAALLLALTACEWGAYPWQVRVPIVDVGARFIIADATWFEDEHTLFIFYQVESNQGLSDRSRIELAFRTDTNEEPFHSLESFPPVHEHLVVSCGVRTLCGSYSTPVDLVPRDVRLQLRYHEEGELTLAAPVDLHIVGSGAPHNSRSAVVYGVFNEENTHAQWRLRHQLPAIRNEHAQALGLRRQLLVDDVTYGTLDDARALFAPNPYGYGLANACPSGFSPHQTPALETRARAVFDPTQLPIESSTAAHVCAAATVTDARGTYTTAAFGQKNPQVRDAFAALQTPIRENLVVPFFLEVCANPTSALHRAMQMQRLFLGEADRLCIDDFATLDFPSRLATTLTQKIDQRRLQGRDMVLVIGLNRPDNRAIARAVEDALALVVPLESGQSTPRLSGAFVFDSAPYSIGSPEVSRLVLWCPAATGGRDLDAISDTSARSCPLQPLVPIALGDASLSSLPILPTEAQFTTFIERYGPQQTGRMTDLSVLAPTRTPTSSNVPLGDFGVATFFNNEAITAAPGDAFSYCATEDTGLVVFRVDGVPDVFPLAVLGEVQTLFALGRYELGLFWEFPFLLHLKYVSTLAAAVDLPEEIPLIAGFGIGTPAEQFLGGFVWTEQQFEVGDALTQCTRFCEHPTFDSAGVYNVDDLFLESYPRRCYRPRFPALTDSGFPIDP